MPTDEERLVVTLEARVRDFERNFARAQTTSDRRLKAIEARAEKSASVLKSIFSGIGSGIASAFAAAGISGLGFTALFAGAKAAAADLASLAAEARRAGVGVEAFQELGYAAAQSRVNIDALTDGLKELQLRADEFIVTGTGSGAEAFGRLGYSAEDLKVKLADPAALFEEIIDKLARLDKASQIRIADEIFGGTGGEQFVQMLDKGAGHIAKMRQEARDTGNVLSEELIAKAIEIDRQFQNFATTVGTSLKGALVGTVSLMREFSDMLNKTGDQSAATLKRRIEWIDAAVANARKSSFAFATIGGEAGIASRLAERAQLQTELDSRPATSITLNKPSGGMGDLSKIQTPASKAADDLKKAYDQIIASGNARIAQLRTETEVVGMGTRQAEAYRAEQEMLAEAQRAGIALSGAQVAKIREIATAQGEAAAAAEAAQASYGNAVEAMDEVRYTAGDVLSGFADDLRSGVSAADALENALNRVLDKLLEIGLQSAITGLFGAPGTASGGSLGGVFSSLFGGFRAAGGPVSAGRPYVVGERGPEMIVPASSGFVIPNHQLGGGGGVKVSINNQNAPAGYEVGEAQASRLADGTIQIDAVWRQIEGRLAQSVMDRGPVGRAIESRYGANPRAGAGR